VLMLVARPAAVWLCLAPFRFSPQEKWFISWVGLRGAVPIVLALFPLLAGVQGANLLFNVAFVVVLVSLLVQGSTIGLMARRLGVALPDPQDEARTRQTFGDFELDGHMPLAAVCQFYGLPPAPDEHATLGTWMAAQIRRPPVAGDRVALGPALLIVRRLEGNRITRVGLSLPS
jgi:potassium/hydrogen antiporter